MRFETNTMVYTAYITKDGDRWDTVAYAAYGALSMVVNGKKINTMNKLMVANRNIPLMPVFPGGVSLVVPILVAQGGIQNGALPPWRRK